MTEMISNGGEWLNLRSPAFAILMLRWVYVYVGSGSYFLITDEQLGPFVDAWWWLNSAHPEEFQRRRPIATGHHGASLLSSAVPSAARAARQPVDWAG